MSGILFLKDWEKYPNAIVHATTKNKSFIRVAQIYKAMGIKNHAFLLALHNPDLEFVDPFSDDLTQEQIEAIIAEIAENPWYFFREIIKIPASGAVNGVHFIANRANIAYLWGCFNHLTVMIIMPRQTGKSVVADSCNVYILIAGGVNIKMVLFTKDNGLRVANIERIKTIFELLPSYVNPRDKSDSNNTENITINALENRLDTAVGQTTLAGAMKVGRGLTVAILQVDELAFIPHIKESLETALAATGAARENAKASGSHYYNTYTTTPGYLNTEEGAYAKSIYDSCCRWNEKLLDLDNNEELISTIKKNTRRGNVSILIEFNHRQLGKTDEWLRERILEANATGDRAEADFLNKWSQGSASSPLSKESLVKIRASIVNKSYIEISTEGYVLNWYVSEDEVKQFLPNRQIVLGMDSSEMIGNDNTTLCGRDVTTGEVLCTALINETNVLTLSNFIANLLVKYRNMIFMPEAKSTGVAIIDTVAQILISKGLNPFTRIYNKIVDEKNIKPEYDKLWSNISKGWGLNEYYNQYRKEFGYRTSSAGKNSRDNLYGTVFNASIKYTGHLIKDEDIVTELESLIIKNGRIDHPTNGHDDMCFVGNTLILTPKGNVPIRDIKPGDEVLTRNGYKKVLATISRTAEVITKYGLTGTPNHPFITPKGIINFGDLTDESEVYIWNYNESSKSKDPLSSGTLLSIKAKNIIETQTHLDGNIESTTGNTIKTIYHLFRYIGKFISTKLGLYQKGIISIIKTKIRLIMKWIISNVFRKKSIEKDILFQKMLCSQTQNEPEKIKVNIYRNGEKNIQKKLKNSKLKMVKLLKAWKIGEKLRLKKYNTSTMLKLVKQKVKKALYKKKSKHLELVYNLTVDDTHEYFANNVLVHNCIAYLLPYYTLTQGNNLECYGIDTSRVLSTVKLGVTEENGGPIEEYRKRRQQQIKSTIDIYLERIKRCEDPFITQQLVSKAKSLYESLDEDTIVAFNLQELLSKISNDARLKRLDNGGKRYAF